MPTFKPSLILPAIAPAALAGLVPAATVRSASDVLHGALVSLSHCMLTLRLSSPLKSGKHDRNVGPSDASASARSRRAMAIAFTAWFTHCAPRGRSMGASPPSQTRTIEPASFLGTVVLDTFSVRSRWGRRDVRHGPALAVRHAVGSARAAGPDRPPDAAPSPRGPGEGRGG